MDDPEQRPEKKSKKRKKEFRKKLRTSELIIQHLNTALIIIGSLLAAAAVGIPIVQYLTVIQPGQQLLETVEAKVNERVEQAIRKNEQAQIDSAYSWIVSGNQDKGFRGVNYLQANPHLRLTDTQISQFLAKMDVDKSNLDFSTLEYVLNLNSPVVAEFLKSQLTVESRHKTFAIPYFITRPYDEQLMNRFRQVILKSSGDEKRDFFLLCLARCEEQFKTTGNKLWLMGFIDSESLIKDLKANLEPQYFELTKKRIQGLSDETGDVMLIETYLFKV